MQPDDLELRLLVVEDDRATRRFLVTLGKAHGFAVSEATSCAEALKVSARTTPDVVLLDLGLPDGDGIDLTRALREQAEMPIIVISARQQERDKVSALDAGADDYLTKPFSAKELLARIRAAVRRSPRTADLQLPSFIVCGALRVDFEYRRVEHAGQEVHLTPTEYKLLVCLARRPGRVLTHKQILDEVWGEAATALPHHVRVHMAQLRRKLEPDPARPRFILTEIGVGYRFSGADNWDS